MVDKNRIMGSTKAAKGAIKQVIGKVVGAAKPEAEGTADKAEGKVQNAVGGLEDALRGRLSHEQRHVVSRHRVAGGCRRRLRTLLLLSGDTKKAAPRNQDRRSRHNGEVAGVAPIVRRTKTTFDQGGEPGILRGGKVTN